jgi:hypothetical protein
MKAKRLTLPRFVMVAGVKVAIKTAIMDDYGQYHSDIRTIAIGQLAFRDTKTLLNTVKHELRHAALDITGLTHLVRYEEEAIVRCLESIFDPAWDKFLAKWQN